MKDRLVTLLGALLALAIVYALFFQRPGESSATQPLSIEAGRNGYLALWNWLAQQGVPVRSLRERYTTLVADESAGGGGNLLVVTMPFRTPLRNAEIEPLQAWIRQGNTVLILAALDDSPDWLPFTGNEFLTNLAMLTGMQFRTSRAEALGEDGLGNADDEAAAADRPEEVAPFALTPPPIAAQTVIELEPVAEHPLLEGVESLRGFSDAPSEVWRGRSPDEYRLALRLAFETSSGLDAMWQLPRGRGQIIVVASASLLANRNIGEGDARQFVQNLISPSSRTGRRRHLRRHAPRFVDPLRRASVPARRALEVHGVVRACCVAHLYLGLEQPAWAAAARAHRAPPRGVPRGRGRLHGPAARQARRGVAPHRGLARRRAASARFAARRASSGRSSRQLRRSRAAFTRSSTVTIGGSRAAGPSTSFDCTTF